MNFFSIFEQVIVLFLILIVGYLARKLKIIDEAVTRGFSSLLLKVSLPALIIDSLQQDFSAELLGQSWQILTISFFVYAGSALLAFILSKALAFPRQELGVLRFAMLFSNVGFMGYPVIQAVFGGQALFHAAIYNLPFNLLVFTLGVLVISLGQDNGRRLEWRMFVNPATVAVAIGFVLFIGSWHLPTAIATAVKQVGSLTTPLSMILIGSLLANMQLGTIFGNWRVHLVSLVRLLVIPALVWSVLRLIFTDPLLVGVPTIIAAMPAATNTAILAEEYQANPAFASQVVFVSTLFSMLTIPLLAYWLIQ